MRQYFGFSKQNMIDWFVILFFIILIASIAGAQNVGIGITTPTVPLDVFSNNAYISRFNSTSPNMFIGLSENNNIRGYLGSYSGLAEDVDFGTASSNLSGKLHFTIQATPKMTIDNTGKVGIGTLNPSRLLTVQGGSLLDNGNTNNGSLEPGLVFGSDAKTGIGVNKVSGYHKDGLSFFTNNVRRMLIDSAGRVAISGYTYPNTVPSQRLEVNGKVKIGDDNISPVAGTIRWNATISDLEVFDGYVWKSLTKASQSSWGNNLVTESQIICPQDNDAGDDFSHSVSISGNYIIVGSPRHSETGTSKGAAYIYYNHGDHWSFQAKLTAIDGEDNDEFGTSVSINGDYCIVGAPKDDIGPNPNQGSAYIFVRSGTSSWTQQAKLTDPSGSGYDAFGLSVSISGLHCIVGIPFDDIGSNQNQGSAIIFQRTGATWNQSIKLTASDGSNEDKFGLSVAIDDTRVIIGSPGDDITNEDQGSAYAYSKSNNVWSLDNKLMAPVSQYQAGFGVSVSIDETTIAIGAPTMLAHPNGTGVVFVYKKTLPSWIFHSKISTTSVIGQSNFGNSVSVFGDNILIGSLGHNDGIGSAYLYQLNNAKYDMVFKLQSSNGAQYDLFGISVALSQNHLIIGSNNSLLSSQGGAGYIFSRN